MRNQLEQLARPGDAVLASPAAATPRTSSTPPHGPRSDGLPVAVLVGRNGGRLSEYADIELRVDSTDMQVLENVHLVVVHWLFKALTHESRTGPANPHPHE